ncbi:MAG TPA: hypothetical protein VIQ31_26570, partial [Phormidium sp.]
MFKLTVTRKTLSSSELSITTYQAYHMPDEDIMIPPDLQLELVNNSKQTIEKDTVTGDFDKTTNA